MALQIVAMNRITGWPPLRKRLIASHIAVGAAFQQDGYHKANPCHKLSPHLHIFAELFRRYGNCAEGSSASRSKESLCWS